ncbi:MAG: aminodeoxychorismate/anthranilate synthase component II [Parvularculaceae bacterium]|nr:aminodeoxychorismate/anthranilate synthase component II [Parvularculaceae bacterium]
MIVVVDNYDSFVHTLARYLREAGAATRVVRNDATTAASIVADDPSGVVLSPGPRTPDEAGLCLDLLERLPARIPALGVCLGHQCLAQWGGGHIRRALRPLHGAASLVRHDATGLLKDAPHSFEAGRYHSLVATLPEDGPLVANAWSEEGEIMGVRRRDAPWHGVQFHPESVLTPSGRAIIDAFVRLCTEPRA